MYRPLFFCLLYIFSITGHAQDAESPQVKINAYFTALTEIGQFNGVVLVKRGTDSLLSKAYNNTVFPAWARVNTHSRFHIASVRKLFNQYIVYQLADPKLIDQPLHTFVDLPQINRNWTIEMLLAHKSGLPRGERFEFGPRQYDDMATRELIASQKLLFEPGKQEHYSNFGYLLADIALADWYHLPTREVMQRLVFSPLSMTKTFSSYRLPAEENVATGMYEDEGRILAADTSLFTQFESGDVFSTIDDLDLFLRSQSAPQLFEENIVEHAGAKRGFRSYVYYNKKTDTSVVVLSNLAIMPIVQTITDLKKMLAGESVPLPQAIHRKAGPFHHRIAAAITGEYQLEVNGQHLAVTCKGNRLFLHDLSNKTKEPDELFFETSSTLFWANDTTDSLLVEGQAGDPAIVITGMGNMRFPTKRIHKGKGCSH
ncbi:MAG: beta-lactamase family protein [Alphaproteobacteria bacterium]|nr:beta-lactamase family protein [Alphaproteobacteria bacterium]